MEEACTDLKNNENRYKIWQSPANLITFLEYKKTLENWIKYSKFKSYKLYFEYLNDSKKISLNSDTGISPFNQQCQ